MDNSIKIVKLIEKKRAELNQLVQGRNKFDDNAVKISQELDLLLNIFTRSQQDKLA